MDWLLLVLILVLDHVDKLLELVDAYLLLLDECRHGSEIAVAEIVLDKRAESLSAEILFSRHGVIAEGAANRFM